MQLLPAVSSSSPPPTDAPRLPTRPLAARPKGSLAQFTAPQELQELARQKAVTRRTKQIQEAHSTSTTPRSNASGPSVTVKIHPPVERAHGALVVNPVPYPLPQAGQSLRQRTSPNNKTPPATPGRGLLDYDSWVARRGRTDARGVHHEILSEQHSALNTERGHYHTSDGMSELYNTHEQPPLAHYRPQAMQEAAPTIYPGGRLPPASPDPGHASPAKMPHGGQHRSQGNGGMQMESNVAPRLPLPLPAQPDPASASRGAGGETGVVMDGRLPLCEVRCCCFYLTAFTTSYGS